jgi:hypothetical protein
MLQVSQQPASPGATFDTDIRLSPAPLRRLTSPARRLSSCPLPASSGPAGRRAPSAPAEHSHGPRHGARSDDADQREARI